MFIVSFMDVRLALHHTRCMQVHDYNSFGNRIHTKARHNVVNRPAAAESDASKLCKLIADAVFIHHAAQFAQILCTRITGAGLAA